MVHPETTRKVAIQTMEPQYELFHLIVEWDSHHLYEYIEEENNPLLNENYYIYRDFYGTIYYIFIIMEKQHNREVDIQQHQVLMKAIHTARLKGKQIQIKIDLQESADTIIIPSIMINHLDINTSEYANYGKQRVHNHTLTIKNSQIIQQIYINGSSFGCVYFTIHFTGCVHKLGFDIKNNKLKVICPKLNRLELPFKYGSMNIDIYDKSLYGLLLIQQVAKAIDRYVLSAISIRNPMTDPPRRGEIISYKGVVLTVNEPGELYSLKSLDGRGSGNLVIKLPVIVENNFVLPFMRTNIADKQQLTPLIPINGGLFYRTTK